MQCQKGTFNSMNKAFLDSVGSLTLIRIDKNPFQIHDISLIYWYSGVLVQPLVEKLLARTTAVSITVLQCKAHPRQVLTVTFWCSVCDIMTSYRQI